MLFPVLGAKYVQRRIFRLIPELHWSYAGFEVCTPQNTCRYQQNASSKKTTEITEIETAKAFPPLPQPSDAHSTLIQKPVQALQRKTKGYRQEQLAKPHSKKSPKKVRNSYKRTLTHNCQKNLPYLCIVTKRQARVPNESRRLTRFRWLQQAKSLLDILQQPQHYCVKQQPAKSLLTSQHTPR